MIMTISIIPDFFDVEIVEMSVNFRILAIWPWSFDDKYANMLL
jgi:hypothetical protein